MDKYNDFKSRKVHKYSIHNFIIIILYYNNKDVANSRCTYQITNDLSLNNFRVKKC